MKRILIIFFVGALTLCSCDRNQNSESIEGKTRRQVSEQLYFGKYTKELLVYDSSKENSALIKVGTDDLSYFESLNADNLELIPIEDIQSSQEAVELYL